MKKIGIGKLGIFALAVALPGLALVGCNEQNDSPTSFAQKRSVGGIGFKLTLPGGVSVSEIKYTISGPSAYTKTGTIPVGGSGTTFSAKIDGLPAGKGFTIKLEAEESSSMTECMGSASFDVVANMTTAVSVKLQCPGKKGGSTGDGVGSVTINGTVNICAVVESATATPASDGKTYTLTGLGSDSDMSPSALTYKWTASAGTLSGTSAANVTLTCPASGGDVSVVFEVADGTPAEGGCGDKLVLSTVNCTPCTSNCGSSGGAGAGGAGAGGAGAGGAGAGGAGAGGAGAGGAGAGGAGAGGAGAGGAGAGGAGAGGAGAGGAGAGGAGAGGAGAGGAGAGGAGAGGAGAGGQTGGGTFPGDTAACNACRLEKCKDYQGQGFDVYAGCFKAIDSALGAPAGDPTFIQECTDVMKCAYANKCGFNDKELGECFCGTAVFDECFSTPKADGVCKDVITKAARSTQLMDISVRFTDLAFPLGWAFYLQKCDSSPTECATVCIPK